MVSLVLAAGHSEEESAANGRQIPPDDGLTHRADEGSSPRLMLSRGYTRKTLP